MREIEKEFTVGNRRFRVKKFDALTGSYIIYTLLTQILPMGLGKQVAGLEDNAPANAPVMNKETFMDIQRSCLKTCFEIVPAGGIVTPMPVMLADGRWGIGDLENDAPTVMLLTIQVLGFNVQSFFDESVLKEFKTSISQLNLSNA